MTTFNLIPLTGIPEVFTVTLAGNTYTFQVVWRDAPWAGWMLDIADVNGYAIISGIPLVTGADLLAQYAYQDFGGGLMLYNAGDVWTPPNYYNLGTAVQLYFVTEP
jgi:hypothetical protein